MTNIYTGRIRSVIDSDTLAPGARYHLPRCKIGFVSKEEGTQGLSIFIQYKFESWDSQSIFKGDLKKRLDKCKSVGAEVCLTKPLDRMVGDYEGIGPIRFLEDEPPRAA